MEVTQCEEVEFFSLRCKKKQRDKSANLLEVLLDIPFIADKRSRGQAIVHGLGPDGRIILPGIHCEHWTGCFQL